MKKNYNHLENPFRDCEEDYNVAISYPHVGCKMKKVCTNVKHFRCGHSDGVIKPNEKMRTSLARAASVSPGGLVDQIKAGNIIHLCYEFNVQLASL